MSTDKRARLIQSIEEGVYKFTEAETATFIVNDIIKILNDFEISDRCTDVVVYDEIVYITNKVFNKLSNM